MVVVEDDIFPQQGVVKWVVACGGKRKTGDLEHSGRGSGERKEGRTEEAGCRLLETKRIFVRNESFRFNYLTF